MSDQSKSDLPLGATSPTLDDIFKGQPKWRRFEELVADVQRQFTGPDAKVTTDEKILGRRSGKVRQLDICIRQAVGQYEIFVVIDCKDYKRPVDVKRVEEFLGLLEDVGAEKGAIFSAAGFTDGAKQRAADARVDLQRVLDSGDHPWNLSFSLPMLVVDRSMTRFALRFSSTGGYMEIPTDQPFTELVLYRANGTPIGTTRNLVIDRWEEGAVPREPGLHEGIPPTNEETWVKSREKFYRVDVTATCLVEEKIYFGMIGLEKVRGLSNEVTGDVLFKGFQTETIDTDVIIRTWKVLTPEQAAQEKVAMKLQIYGTWEKQPIKP